MMGVSLPVVSRMMSQGSVAPERTGPKPSSALFSTRSALCAYALLRETEGCVIPAPEGT